MINGFSSPKTGSVLTGRQVYNAVVSVVQRLGSIRKYHTDWYHQVQGNMVWVANHEGKAVFKDNLPGVNGYTWTDSPSLHHQKPDQTPGNYMHDGWERSTNTGHIDVTVPNLDLTGKIISAGDVTKFFQDIYNSWQNLYNNTIVYKYYTCHQNCHGNCHSSRGRR